MKSMKLSTILMALIFSHLALAAPTPEELGFSLQEQDVNEVTVEDFFRKPEIDDETISPDGAMVIYEKFNKIIVTGNGSEAQQIYAIDSSYNVTDLTWIGNRMLMVELRAKNNGRRSFEILDIQLNSESNKFEVARHSSFHKNGYIIDPVIERPEMILFAEYKTNDDKQLYTDAYRVNLFNKKVSY